MGKITLDITANAADLLNGTDEGIAGIKELAAQGKVTKESLKRDFAEAGKSTKEFNNAIDGTVKSLVNEGKTVEALILKYGSAAAAQKAMQKELINMAVAGQEGTKEFNELRKAAADLKDTIEDTRGSVKKLASDTSTFDKIAEGGGAMAAGFSAAAGAASLFGDENENLQRSVQKAQGAMALLLGVQEIANIATTEGGIATGFATAAQGAYAFVVGTSTGALKAFRIALAATGIGLVVLAIAALVTNWDSLTEAVGMSNNELKGFTKLREEAANSVVNEAGKVGLLIEKYKNANTSQKERKQIIEELKQQSPSYFGTLDTEKTSIENLESAYKKYVQALILKATAEGLANKIAQNSIDAIQEQSKSVEETLTTYDKFRVGLNQVIQTYTGIQTQGSYVVAANRKHQSTTKELALENEKLTKALQDVIAQMEDLGGDPSEKAAKAIQNLVKQFSIATVDKKILTENVNEIVSAFSKAGLPPAEQVKLLRALGFNDTAIFKALSEAADKMAKDGSGIVKLPVEPLFIEPKELPNIEVLGFKVPVKLDITQEEADKISSAINQIADNVFKTLNTAFDTAIQTQQKFINTLDDRIEKQKDVVAAEQKLANEGKANNLAIEVAGLEKLNKARESALEKQKKIKNAQVALDTISQLSSLITASAKIYESLANIPVVGVPLATALVATMFAAFAASKVAGAVLTSQSGFREGGYTGDGDPSQVSTAQGNRGYKYHKKEFVMNEQLTSEHRDFFEALHNDDKVGILFGISDLLKGTGVVLPDENLPLKLKTAKDEHRRIEGEESNYELAALRKELVEIKEEVKGWRKQPKESTSSFGDKLIIKKGNKTTVVTKLP